MNKILFKTNQNHPQIQAYKKAVEQGLSSHHVLPIDGGWMVKRAGASKASAKFATKVEAVAEAKIISQNNHTNLFIHGSDGKIQQRY